MIRYKVEKKIPDNYLERYTRHAITNQVYFLDDNVLKIKNDHFVEEWDYNQLSTKTKYLQDNLKNGGVVVGVYDSKRVIGFTAVEPNQFNGYLNMSYCHIDKNYRGQSLGKRLFYISALMIKNLGYDKIYISTHPSVESHSFYKSVGCKLTSYINKDLLELEPLDIQMEYLIDEKEVIRKMIDIEFVELGK